MGLMMGEWLGEVMLIVSAMMDEIEDKSCSCL